MFGGKDWYVLAEFIVLPSPSSLCIPGVDGMVVTVHVCCGDHSGVESRSFPCLYALIGPSSGNWIHSVKPGAEREATKQLATLTHNAVAQHDILPTNPPPLSDGHLQRAWDCAFLYRHL